MPSSRLRFPSWAETVLTLQRQQVLTSQGLAGTELGWDRAGSAPSSLLDNCIGHDAP